MSRLAMFFPALLLSAGISTLGAAEYQPRHGAVSTSGSCSAFLSDGRSFITGGGRVSAPLASTHFFEKDGGIESAAPMLAPRAAHVCIALPDGSILVAGGSSGPGGPTNAAEIYQPATDTWTTTGAMLTARTNAAAILMNNHQVLIAGGETSGQIANTLEIYDPAAARFRLAHGVLSSPRANHAIAVLADGRILIAGGSDGARVLDTMDIFDPATEEIRSAGFMTTPRSDFTATALADGRVLLAAGFDGNAELATAEAYNPITATTSPLPSLAAPRRLHIAIRPSGASNVLIAGGASNGRETDSAEIFLAASNRFVAAIGTRPPAGASKVTTVAVAALDSNGKPRSVKTYVIDPEN
jgi:hypothetical protein